MDGFHFTFQDVVFLLVAQVWVILQWKIHDKQQEDSSTGRDTCFPKLSTHDQVLGVDSKADMTLVFIFWKIYILIFC